LVQTPYQKLKRCRQRKRLGRTVLPIEIDQESVADRLIDAGFLQAWDADDRQAVRHALEQLLDEWVQV
jgi:hypothetical protein